MKKIIYFLALTLVFMYSYNLYSISDIQIETNIRTNLNTSSEGTEFYVAFPYNDNRNQPGQNLAIYVTSRTDNEVTLYNEQLGVNFTKSVLANKTIEFSTNKGGLGWDAEIYDFEKAIEYGYRITSEYPVSVFVLNSKNVTSEGYMAIPTRNWGKEYIHNSFYDFKEVREWGGGFVVMAKEDNTEIEIILKDGANNSKGFGNTTSGMEHGDVLKASLNAGEVFAVQGTGTTRGVFDLSGTRILSNKPVGLISYHNRTMIPSTLVTSGRDHLSEMLPAIDTWGKEYVSVEIDRGTNKGDYFRVIAGEDNTTFNVSWYDKETKELISSIGPIKLRNKGDWYEYNGAGANMPHDLESIRGVSHFKANKPILVVQYSYSVNYDGTEIFDPFMIVLASTEQYTKSAISTRPKNYSNIDYRNNFINIIAKGDSSDEVNNKKILNSITLNDVAISFYDGNFSSKRIPNTDYYWTTLTDVNFESLLIESETEFTSFLYGFSKSDSYAWPASSNSKNLSVIDTLSPAITSMGDGCNFKFTVKDDPVDDRNGDISDKPRQFDSGVDREPTLKTGSFNFNLPRFIDNDGFESDWPTGNTLSSFDFGITIVDPKEDAMGIVEVIDKAGNTTEVTIFYEVDKVSIEIENNTQILRSRVNVDLESNIIIRNLSNYPVTMNDISFKGSSNFEIDDFDIPVTLGIDSIYTQSLYYHPQKQYLEYNFGKETDTIEVELDCLVWSKETNGQGFIPTVEVSNMKFSPTKIDEGISKQKGIITITNNSKSSDKTFPDLLVKSIEVDMSAPNSALFSDFKVVENNKSIGEVKDLTLSQGQSITVEFNLNTDSGTIGDKITRLIVITDSGPANNNGEVPTVVNNYEVEFDGIYTVNNQSAIDDGGYIIASLVGKVQSSVDNTEINQPLKVSIVSANPMNNNLLRLNFSNEEQSIVSVNITDLEGKVIMELMNEYVGSESIVKEFNINDLKSGTYFISATDDTNKTTTKFIIAE